MTSSSYLPLLAGLAAPLLVLALVAAGRKAAANVAGSRGGGRGKTGALTTPKPRPKRLLSILSAASAVLVLGAGVAFAVDRGLLPTVMKREPSPTVPTPDPRVEGNPPAEDSSRTKRRAAVAKPGKPRAVAVSVMNAAGIQGLAATKSQLLRGKKVKLKTVATAPATRGESVVFFKPRSAGHARRVGRLLEIRRVEPATPEVTAWGQGAPVTVVLGRDASRADIQG